MEILEVECLLAPPSSFLLLFPCLLLHFKSKLGVLGVYGKLIKSSTSLIRGIFPIIRHFHAHFWLTLKGRQFCVVFVKRLYLEFYCISWAEIYRAPNRPIDEQLCSFKFCLKMLLRSSNFQFKIVDRNSGFRSRLQYEYL